MPGFVSKGGNADRARVLEGLKLIRDGVEAPPKNLGSHGGFAGVLVSMPELDYAVAKALFPDLSSPDWEIRRKAWLAFADSPAGEPYRVHRKKRGPQCRSITAR